MKTAILILVLLILTAVPVSAYDFDSMSSSDKAAFDQILRPVMKIYNFIKYAATVVGAIVMLVSGVSYMMSGYDPKKREQAKNMAMYVIIGLLVIWAAPMMVNLLVG
jgi:flagellar basal body-associated protein FliL